MGQPTSIKEIVYSDATTVDSTRTTQAASGSCYWVTTTLPASGLATLDSTVGNNNCEVVQYIFSGHGAGNYVTNFKYYVDNRNSVAIDMTHIYMSDSTFIDPSSYTDADIYGLTGSWGLLDTSEPASSNLATHTDYSSTGDPTRSEYIYNAVAVEAFASTGSATWEIVLIYQYT
jgi:hypothetical protein